MTLSQLIEELLEGLEEYGDLDVVINPDLDRVEQIRKLYVSGDGEVCIASVRH